MTLSVKVFSTVSVVGNTIISEINVQTYTTFYYKSQQLGGKPVCYLQSEALDLKTGLP